MQSTFLTRFVKNFILFSIPKGKSYLVINEVSKLKTKSSRKYDYIILNNILKYEKDIQRCLEEVYEKIIDGGKIIIIYQNYLYFFMSGFFGSFVRDEKYEPNWLSTADLKAFIRLSDFEYDVFQPLLLLPFPLPLISDFANELLLHIFPFNHFSTFHFITATKRKVTARKPSVSIVVPARNEEGNIRELISSLPSLGRATEILFVEGHSKDRTYQEIEKNLHKLGRRKNFSYKLLKQKGKGKADAVATGFKEAKGDILLIYDADMTVRMSDLSKFYFALWKGQGEFINGSRLVYPVAKGSMQFINILGNKFFSILYSWILGQPVKDTLCGTKALWRKHYQQMEKNGFFPDSRDPFGDFSLLVGAARLHLKIVDLPVRYFERTYGSTNIKRFTNAVELFLLSLTAIKILKMHKNE